MKLEKSKCAEHRESLIKEKNEGKSSYKSDKSTKITQSDGQNKTNDVVEMEEQTTCGECIPTIFAWITSDQQKARAEELASMTKGISDAKKNTNLKKEEKNNESE